MKKHDEGYVLAYVVVIMAVLTTIALSVMSVSLSNLQKQRAEVERMQDKYAAEGDIEQVIARLDANRQMSVGVSDLLEGTEVHPELDINAEARNVCTLTLERQGKSVKIICKIKVTCASDIETELGGYRFDRPEWEYESYTITSVTSEETEGGGESVPK